MPLHIVAKDKSEGILGVVPLYLKRFLAVLHLLISSYVKQMIDFL